jgi:hypothetical protein
LQAHWTYGQAGYRCRHGHTTVAGLQPDRIRNLYRREDTLIQHVTTSLPALQGAGRPCVRPPGRSRPRRAPVVRTPQPAAVRLPPRFSCGHVDGNMTLDPGPLSTNRFRSCRTAGVANP